MAKALVLAVLAAAACGSQESGIAPPDDRFFYPTGLVVDRDDRWLYVVNSNSNLRYNTGTVVAVDLDAVRRDGRQTWQACPTPSHVAEEGDPDCCRDHFDRGILNCRETPYFAKNAAGGPSVVRIGSFGGAAMLIEPPAGGAGTPRLFVTVRGDPSVTFIDLLPGPMSVSLRCSTEPNSADAPICDEAWQIRGIPGSDDELDLLEEPFALAFDEPRRILYVGHLSAQPPTTELGGVSVIDLCGAGRPRLSAVNRLVFPSTVAQSVTAVTLAADNQVFVTSRTAPEVGTLVLKDPAAAMCDGSDAPRSLDVVTAQSLFSTAFALGSVDLRGFLLSADESRAYVLHRDVGRDAPPAIAVIDRTPDAVTGRRANQAIGVVEVCTGATEMRLHDVGPERGARLFVTCFDSGQIYVVDPARLTVTNVIDVGRGPNTIAFPTANSRVAYVSGFADNNVSVVDLVPGSATEYRVVQRIGFPRPSGTQ